MTGFRACLLDVYETVLSCDFSAHAAEMPLVAGLPTAKWNEAFFQHAGGLNAGRSSLAEVYGEVLRTCGREIDATLVPQLLDRDRELLFETSRLHDDTIPFLRTLRRRGIATAFVSNCAENTRPLLAHVGLTELVDELVLSCEVRSAKPDAGIFQAALDALGVMADEALFVDDQPAYCEGARALGITAVCISRSPEPHPGDPSVVRSLRELEALF